MRTLWADMKRRYQLTLVVLSVLLITTVITGIVLNTRAAKSAFAMGDTDSTTEIDEIYDKHADELTEPPAEVVPLVEQALEPPLIAVGWESSMFYDPETDRLLTGGYVVQEMVSNYSFDEHLLIFEAVEWRYRRVSIGDSPKREILLDGSTLTIHSETSCFAELDPEGAYIQLTDPKTKYAKVVVIDPGHGGIDFGAVQGAYEKDINLDIALRLLDMMDDEQVLLIPTRTDDTFISLEDRYTLANRMGDYFIAIHNNVDERSANTNGTITYHHTHDNDTPITSEALAEIVQAALVDRLETRDRGATYANEYRLLINTTIPAVIAEIMFLTNMGERERLFDPVCRQDIALALHDAILTLPPVR